MKIPTHRLELLLDNILALILKAALLLTRAQLVSLQTPSLVMTLCSSLSWDAQ